MLELDAAALAARLDRGALIDALDERFPQALHRPDAPAIHWSRRPRADAAARFW